MPKKSTEPELESSTEKWGGQKARTVDEEKQSYYYDDAHGYQVYNPTTEKPDENEEKDAEARTE